MVVESDNAGQDAKEFGKSVRGLEWLLSNDKEHVVRTISQKLNIDPILARILVNRDIKGVEEAQSFLFPKIRDMLPNPAELKDTEKAAQRIAEAIIKKQSIAVFGDYDVDGATSSALLYRFFQMLGVQVEVYIPNRMKEGYGPSTYAFESLKSRGVNLVLTVDCGIVAFEPIANAVEMGLDVIVIDHHLGIDQLPKAVAVVNPNRFDEDFPYKYMAAVGVSFIVAVAVRIALRNCNWFVENNVPEPDLMQILDLVALGTVCDVVPLVGINRAFVAQGLKLIATRNNLGLSVLADFAKLDAKPQSHHLGFIFGPRINAGGRVGEGMLGSRLLATNSPEEAISIAQRLETLNEERKTIEALALEEAIQQIESKNLDRNPVIFAVGQGWHIGILGILAGRLKERYGKPTAVISMQNQVGKGSARSIPGIDVGAAIASAKSTGVLLEGGGHAMAGGFSVAEHLVDAFYEYLVQHINNATYHINNAKKLHIDFITSIRGINPALMAIIEQAAPFGSGNSQPRVGIMDVYVLRVSLVRPNHILLIVGEKPNGGHTLKCMMFKGEGTPVATFISRHIGRKMNIAGTLHSNPMNHKKIDFILEDVSVYE